MVERPTIGMKTGISLQLLLAMIVVVLALVGGAASVSIKAQAALSREEARESYQTRQQARDDTRVMQEQLDRRFSGLDESICRIEGKLDKLIMMRQEVKR